MGKLQEVMNALNTNIKKREINSQAGTVATSIFTVTEIPRPARQPRIIPQGKARN